VARRAVLRRRIDGGAGEAVSCATTGCDDPDCPVCSVPRRFPQTAKKLVEERDTDGLRDDAPALNGTKQRPSRDPRFMKRQRKALTP
jgi:hypothetical protein